jgi:ABC-type glycerol-3-phosphate transport system substrate-binding protein
MPDNQTQGMLETFLKYLVPDERQSLWEYAQEVTQEAKQKGARFKDPHHLDKANIYTWLAWQNPPGRQLHDAVKQKILNPNHPKAQDFVKWFKALYDL